MNISRVLLAAFCSHVLVSLRDGNHARASAFIAARTRLKGHVPDDRHTRPYGLATSGATVSVAKSDVSEGDKTICDVPTTEDRGMNSNVARLVESSLPEVVDAAKEVGVIARSEELMETESLPFYPLINLETFKRTERFAELARGEDRIDVVALERLRTTNKDLVAGPAHVKPDEAIIALLLPSNPTDVAQVLVSLSFNYNHKR